MQPLLLAEAETEEATVRRDRFRSVYAIEFEDITVVCSEPVHTTIGFSMVTNYRRFQVRPRSRVWEDLPSVKAVTTDASEQAWVAQHVARVELRTL